MAMGAQKTPKKIKRAERQVLSRGRFSKGVFSATYLKADGGKTVTRPYNVGSTKIKRYIKIVGKANPFDPEFKSYFETRKRYRESRIEAELQWWADMRIAMRALT